MNVGIRKWRTDDAEDLAKAMNNKNIHDNLRDGIPFPYAVSDAQAFISDMLGAERDKTYSWAITLDDIVVGSVGVFREDNVHRLTGEIGYWLAQEHWGKGAITQAIKLACRYIFEQTDIVRIFALPFDFNAASCRALEKTGFVCEGILRKNAIKNGEIVDACMYAIIRED